MIEYSDGVNKTTKISCKVLGFWGDIVISPFWTLGLTVDNYDEIK